MQKSAEFGSEEGQAHYALTLASDSKNGKANDPEAIEWFKRGAEQGDPLGELYYGRALEHGASGITKDLAAAGEWYLRAANQGLPEAEYQMANYIFQSGAVRSDRKQIQMWLSKAADGNYPLAIFQLGLNAYSLRQGKEAQDYFQRGADLGHPDSEAALGVCLLQGCGGSVRASDGVTWLRKAAAEGSVNGMYQLGNALVTGADGRPD